MVEAHTLGLHRVQMIQNVLQHGLLCIGQVLPLRDLFNVHKSILLYLIVLYHPFAVPVHACIVPLTRTDVKNRFHSGRTSCKGVCCTK